MARAVHDAHPRRHDLVGVALRGRRSVRERIAYARLTRSDDDPIGVPTRLLDTRRDATRPDALGLLAGGGFAGDLPLMAPSFVGIDGIDRWWVEAGRRGASPSSARAIIAAFVRLDVRSVLAEVRVPGPWHVHATASERAPERAS